MKFRDILRYTLKAENKPCVQCSWFTIHRPPTSLKDSIAAKAGETITNVRAKWAREDTFPDLPVLSDALGGGCTLCGALRAFLLSPDVGAIADGTKVAIEGIYPNVDTQKFRPSSLKFEFRLDDGRVQTWRQLTFVLAAPAESSATRQYQTIRLDNPLRTTAKIHNWLIECEKKHAHCQESIPTAGSTGRYAALSHCWGLSLENPIEKQYLLEESNLDSFMQRMPFKDLPKNFQDAITVTRLLGLDYIWIDSICIIQDSPADKSKEIGGMVEVYGNAWITICATSAPNSHAGFLGQRSSISEPAVTMPFVAQEFKSYRPFTNGTYNFYHRKLHEHITGDWSSDVETSDWNSRGWTYQERLVSRRMLHFARNGVYFECLTSDYSEAGSVPREAVFESKIGRGPDYRHLGFFEYFSSQNPIDLSRVYETYYWFVNEYSQRQLSFGGDREAAFSAIVSQFKRLLKSEHVHGLWMNDIYRGLLWRPIDQTKVRNLDHRNRPPLFPNWPSWSWLSSVYRATWSRSHLWVTPLQLQPPIPASDLEIVYSDHQGKPTQLRIKAILIEVDMPLKPKNLAEHPESNRIYTMSQFAVMRIQGQSCGSAWFDESDAEKHIRNGKGFLLQVGQRNFDVSPAHFKNSASGIVVSPTVKGNWYRRVGYFEVDTAEYWKALFEGQIESMITLV